MKIPTDLQINLYLNYKILLIHKHAIHFTYNLFYYNLAIILYEISLNLPVDAGACGTAG